MNEILIGGLVVVLSVLVIVGAVRALAAGD